MDADRSKSQLRKEARTRRTALAAAQPDFAQALAVHAEALALPPSSIVGGYHALADEADPSLLLAALAGRGHTIAFPRVVAKDVPLEFHRIPDGEILQAGAYGIAEPAAHFARAVPSLLLVPLLAFDAGGHRLGYGGGFYDRTLAPLNIPAIGIAFAGQEVSSIPGEAHDRRLDGILTEHGLKRFS
jgi:5-formyltetrahydrofolate cyclo-ligase